MKAGHLFLHARLPFAGAALLVCAASLCAGAPASAVRSGFVDREIEAKLSGAKTAGPCSEAEFHRRVTLDLVGVVPTAAKARAYLAKPDRSALIDGLIQSKEFDSWWARILLEITTDRRAADYDGFEGAFLFRWYRKQLQQRRPYDDMVRAMIAGTGDAENHPEVNFLLLNNVTPSDATARIGSAFLGTTLSCAQCHDHPFDSHKQQEFWGVAAFLSKTRMFVNDADTDDEVRGVKDVGVGQVGNPEKATKSVAPRWLSASRDAARGDRRELADFVVTDPLFAKNFVNRVWARLMGQGLVEPLSGFGAKARPTHPELLNHLAQHFIDSRHDLRAVVKLIVSSNAYQRSSKPAAPDPQPYAKAALRPLTCDQLYRSIRQATGYSSTVPAEDWGPRVSVDRLSYDDLTPVQIFGKYARTLRREVVLLNDPEMHAAIDYGTRRLLKAQGWQITERHFEVIFLSLLSRLPTAAERKHFPQSATKADLEDVFWSVLNSLEFQCNH